MAEAGDPPAKGKDDAEREAGLERLAGKMAKAETANEWKSLVQEFYTNAVDDRVKNRELRRELDTLRGKTPGAEDVVLKGDDAKAYRAALIACEKAGVALKDVPAKLTEGLAAAQKAAGFDRDALVEEAAQEYGWNIKAAKGVVRLHDLKLEKALVPHPEGEKGEDGRVKKVSMVVVKAAKDGEDPTPLDEYVEHHLGDFRDVLAVPETGRGRTTETPPAKGPQPQRFLRQSSGEEKPGKGVSDEDYDARKRGEVTHRV